MSNLQWDGKACVKFSKGTFSILIMLMKLLNTSSAFSVYVAGILVLSDFSSVPEGPYLKNVTDGSYEHWTHCWTSFLQKHFCTGIGRYHFEDVLCLSSCACRKEKESGAIVPQALTCLQLILFPSKWGFAAGIPNYMTLVTQEGPGIAKFQHSCFVLYRISLRF